MIIAIHKDGKVIETREIASDATNENITVIESIPVFEYREGYNGVLKYNTENGVYWDYEEAPIVEPSASPEYLEGYDQALVDLLGGEQ